RGVGGFEVGGVGGLGDGGGEQIDGGPGGRGRARPGGGGGAGDGGGVDHAAALGFGGLGKRDPKLGGQGLVRQPCPGRESTPQGDREAPPELGGAGVEQDRADVVVAVRAQRITEQGIVSGVAVGTGHASAVRADLDTAARTAAQETAVFLPG